MLSVETTASLLKSVANCWGLRQLSLVSIVPRRVHGNEDEELATLLATAIVRLTHLSSLRLRGSITLSRLIALQAQAPMSTVIWLPALRELDLSDNGLCQEGTQSLCCILQRLVNLEHLDISHNEIPDWSSGTGPSI